MKSEKIFHAIDMYIFRMLALNVIIVLKEKKCKHDHMVFSLFSKILAESV